VSQTRKYVEVTRRDRLVELRLHDGNDGPFLWGGESAGELGEVLGEIARDPTVGCVILTGSGDIFCGQGMVLDPLPKLDARDWEAIRWHGEHLLMNLLGIQAPIIACVNGPIIMHPEIPLLSDIVLAAEDSSFHDGGHFTVNAVPGDGLHIFMPLLMGLTRARYFLFTGQTLNAKEAKEIGLVNELHPRENLLPRARELAAEILKRNPLVVRYTRLLLVQHVRKLMHDMLGYGGALEGLAIIDEGLRQDAAKK
jgi:enoyl-CoA hydratase/carnithine racemase